MTVFILLLMVAFWDRCSHMPLHLTAVFCIFPSGFVFSFCLKTRHMFAATRVFRHHHVHHVGGGGVHSRWILCMTQSYSAAKTRTFAAVSSDSVVNWWRQIRLRGRRRNTRMSAVYSTYTDILLRFQNFLCLCYLYLLVYIYKLMYIYSVYLDMYGTTFCVNFVLFKFLPPTINQGTALTPCL